MAIKCPKCGAEYDVTLFTFDRGIRCDCGAWVDVSLGHEQAGEESRQSGPHAQMSVSGDPRLNDEEKLLAATKQALPRLEELLKQVCGHWGYEDPVYRFYHQSMKVYWLQSGIKEIAETLQQLAPHLPLNPGFRQIVDEALAEPFTMDVNQRWLPATRPILEAFFHARYFLEMVCQYGSALSEPPEILPSGWAAVLCLYQLR
jgi:hypothetical protein